MTIPAHRLGPSELPRHRWLLVALTTATLAVLAYPVNGNIRYQVGVTRVSGFSVAETFTHRPIAFRLLNAAQAWLPEALSRAAGPPGSLARVWAFEAGFRSVAALLAAGAAALLWAGLRRHLGASSWPYAVAAYAALMFTAPATGEPDWLAALLAVAAVGAGLLWRPAVGAAVAGTLLALSALVKISTLPVAVAALVVLWALDRNRAWIAALAALASGVVAVGLIAWLAPYEIAWLLDIRALQPDPWTGEAASEAGQYAINLAARWPAMALLPAFFVGARRTETWPAALAVGLAAFGIAYQGQYYIYHAIGLLTLSAGLAVRTVMRSRGALRWPVLGLCCWTLVLFMLPADWRGSHAVPLHLATGAWVLGLAGWQWFALRRPVTVSRVRPGWWAAVLSLAGMLATQTPISAESLTIGPVSQTARANLGALRADLRTAAEIHDLIGADTQVVYLTFGASSYLLGNPTHCRYPSPLFLQRPESLANASLATRQENLACLLDPGAGWLVWDRNWLHRKGAPDDLIATIDQNWACDEAVQIGHYTLCRRRT